MLRRQVDGNLVGSNGLLGAAQIRFDQRDGIKAERLEAGILQAGGQVEGGVKELGGLCKVAPAPVQHAQG